MTNGRFGITALPDGRIAYITQTSKGLEIMRANADGTEPKALTTDSFQQQYIAASPDGRYLVFTSDQAGDNHIFRMNSTDGSEITQLTFGSAFNAQPDVSPDGNWVVYRSYRQTSDERRSTIWKVPLAGGAAIQLTDYESGSPVFAPDGKTIACELPSDSPAKNGSITVISAEGGEPLKTFQVMRFGHNYHTLCWTPDGKAIVFHKAEKGVYNLWQPPLSGDAPQQVTNFPSGAIWNFAYSHDGTRIFLSRGNQFVDVVLIKNFR
jgi:Tol biopolymer transport system component